MITKMDVAMKVMLLLLWVCTYSTNSVVRAESRVYRVQWTVDNFNFPRRSINVNDDIIFNWSSDNNLDVWLYPSEDCNDDTGAIFIGSSTPTSFLVVEKHANTTLFFTTTKGNHCQDNGVHVTFDINPSTSPPPPPLPTPAPLTASASMFSFPLLSTLTVGVTLSFLLRH